VEQWSGTAILDNRGGYRDHGSGLGHSSQLYRDYPRQLIGIRSGQLLRQCTKSMASTGNVGNRRSAKAGNGWVIRG
jgi:hypothetical protein